MADIDYDKLQRHFERALKNAGVGSSGGTSWSSSGGGGGGGSAMGAASTAASEAFNKAVTEGSGLIKGLGGAAFDLSGKFIQGGVRVSDVSKTLSDSFTKAGYSGGTLAKVFGQGAGAFSDIVKYVEQGVDKFRDLSQTGAAFNNDVIELRVSAANTRLTLDEFGDVIKNGSKFLTGLGATGSQGAKAFTEFSKSFFDSGVGDNLRNLGYTTKDINELLLTQMTTTKLQGKLTDEQMKKEIESAANLAYEMDAVAKLTGKSRKEQEEELRKQQENGQVRAAIELAVVKGGEDVRKAFNSLSTASKIGGKDFEKMQEEIFAMGRPSQEMAEKFALAGGEAQKLMFAAADAAKKGDEMTAKRLTQEAAAAYAQQQMSKTNLSIAAQGVQGAMDGVAASRQLTDSLRAVAKENNLDLNNSKERAKALDLVNKKIKEEQDARAGATATVINAEARGADITAALNNQLVKPLNEKVNPELLKFSKYLEDLNKGAPGGFRGKTETEIKSGINAVMSEFERGTKTTGGVAPNTPAVNESRQSIEATSPTIPPGAAKELEKVYTALGSKHAEALTKRLDEIAAQRGISRDQLLTGAAQTPQAAKDLTSELAKDPASKKALDAAERANELIRRNAESARTREERAISPAQPTALGTALEGGKGVLESLSTIAAKTISLFKLEGNLQINGMDINKKASGGFVGKPEISLIGEAGPEWVLNKEQMAATLEGAATRGIEQVSKLLPAPTQPGINLSEISRSISTTISSVTGGTERTTRQVETPQSEEIKKQQEELWKKFGEEWQKRKEVLIEGMALEDRKFSKVQALMKADEEAQKIKTDYEKKKEELNKKYYDSIRTEISIKETAVEETKALIAEETKLLNIDSATVNEETSTNTQQDVSVIASELPALPKPASPIDLNSFNLPGFGQQLRAGAASIPVSVKKAEAEAAQKTETAQRNAQQQPPAPPKPQVPPEPASKNASLNDVVKSLDHLNIQMGQLISQQRDLLSKQIKTTKGVGSINQYEKL